MKRWGCVGWNRVSFNINGVCVPMILALEASLLEM